MKVKRTSLISGKTHVMELPVTASGLHAYHGGNANIQDVFPHLTDEQREFIKSGITPEEWQTYIVMGGDYDDDSDPFEAEEGEY